MKRSKNVFILILCLFSVFGMLGCAQLSRLGDASTQAGARESGQTQLQASADEPSDPDAERLQGGGVTVTVIFNYPEAPACAHSTAGATSVAEVLRIVAAHRQELRDYYEPRNLEIFSRLPFDGLNVFISHSSPHMSISFASYEAYLPYAGVFRQLTENDDIKTVSVDSVNATTAVPEDISLATEGDLL
jgi:hypothetical protein